MAAAAGLLVSRAARRAYPLNSVAVRHILRVSSTAWQDGEVQGHGTGILNAYTALQTLDRMIDRGSAETI